MKFTKMLDLITNVLSQDADTQIDVCMTSQMANQIELDADVRKSVTVG